MRRAWAIAKRDLEDALRNSTFLLILIGPVVCSVLFFQLSSDENFAKPRLGVVGSCQEGLGLVLSTSDSLSVEQYPSVAGAREALRKEQIDGLIEIPEAFLEDLLADEFPLLHLEVINSEALLTKLLERALEAAGRTMAGQELPLELLVNGTSSEDTEDKDLSSSLLPNWLVFTAMSGLMFCSASIIEEKDQRTLLGVLTAPVSMVELWVGKVGSGFILAFLSTLAVLLGNGILPSGYLVVHLMVGCLAFAALGILVGLMCSNVAAANACTSTLFMLIYIPLALQEMSQVLQRVAALSPAFYLQRGARELMDGHLGGMQDLAVLAAFVLAFAILALAICKKPEKVILGT